MKHFGCTRRVFLVGRWAIKLPTWSDINHFFLGMIHNRNEAIRWETEDYENRYLARVVLCAPLGLLLVMERLRPLVGDDGVVEKEWDASTKRLKERFDHLWFVKDIKPDNFGYRSGCNTLVCFDYGDL